MKVTQMPVDDLAHFHKNPRQGNVSRVAASLRTNGQYKPIVVNVGTKTGRPNEVLTGNHVLKAARSLGWVKIAVHLVDLTDAEAARIVLADNKTSDDSTYDSVVLDELLQELADEAEDVEVLEGSGYTMEDVDDIALEAAEEADRREDAARPEGSAADVLKASNAVVSFTIVFDDAAQRATWDRWVRELRQAGDGGTLGSLITAALEEMA